MVLIFGISSIKLQERQLVQFTCPCPFLAANIVYAKVTSPPVTSTLPINRRVTPGTKVEKVIGFKIQFLIIKQIERRKTKIATKYSCQTFNLITSSV